MTSLPGLAELVAPTLLRLQADYPDLRVRYVSDARLFRLEYGEAHVAIRAGGKPQEPDNVVQTFCTQRIGLYAAERYVAARGLPVDGDDLAGLAPDDVPSGDAIAKDFQDFLRRQGE